MTEFKDAVEKQRGLQAYEEWAQQIRYIHSDGWDNTRTVVYNDGTRKLYNIKTNQLIYEKPRNKRRRDLINSNAFSRFLEKIGFYGENNETGT
jgi:hypothetical protein